jgi:phosphoserine phosphatase
MDPTYHDIICFDVDSTLVSCEGVDWLADQKGVGEQVRRLTQLSMDGVVLIDEVFQKKIDILAPSRKELQAVGEHYLTCLTPGAKELVSLLHQRNKELWLVTGGLHEAIVPLSRFLNISNIQSNTVFFNANGDYAGIDPKNILTRADGKATFVKNFDPTKAVAFVGDSVTDLATKPYIKTFIGFGGIVVREKVKKNCEFYVSTKNMLSLIDLLLTSEEKINLTTTTAL